MNKYKQKNKNSSFLVEKYKKAITFRVEISVSLPEKRIWTYERG